MSDTAEKIVEEQEVQQDLDFGNEKPIQTPKKDDAPFEVEIVDDRPEEDRVPKRNESATTQVEDDDDEAKNYSEKVQKRIKALKYDYHEERRAKEEASRLQEEALNYAKKLQKENEELRKSLSDGESVLINQAKGRVDAELEKAKKDYKEAYESGDPDKLVEASSELARIQSEKQRVDSYVPPKPQQPKKQETPIPQQPQKPQVSQRALDWANENTWFNKDSRMTSYAFGVHEELVKKGVVGDSEEYYKEIDREMRKVFPDKFDDVNEDEETQQSQTGIVVAPTKRSAKKPRTVRLTSTQVNLANRLGLTKEQYAAQLMKDQGNG
tara:strand:+ start:1283 stop:2257 length:975 start_codon:yes stop_codon:yes gene_type:complete